MALNNYLKEKSCNIVEGFSRSVYQETILLQLLASNNNIKNILEIGFNAGHSAEIFLQANSNCNVVSFDIGEYNCVNIGKEYIDKTYPNRHTLILGDSTKTVPTYETDIKYDLIFIDGGHSYEIANADLLNCKRLAHKDTIVIMDDIINTKNWVKEWNLGPNRAWNEGLKNNLIAETNHFDFEAGRGVSWGKYIL
jgi:predicted O-methyltransferase YrrM